MNIFQTDGSSKLNGKTRRGVVSSVADVASDVTNLAELQFRLLAVDVAESKRHLVIPVSLVVLGLFFALSAGPIVLLVIAAGLYEFANLSMTTALGIVAGLAVIMSATLLLIGTRGLGRAVKFFERSLAELKQNVEWLKQLKNRNRSRSSVANEAENWN